MTRAFLSSGWYDLALFVAGAAVGTFATLLLQTFELLP